MTPLDSERKYVAVEEPVSWQPKSRTPRIVLAQLDATYAATRGPIRHAGGKTYTRRLFDVLAAAQRWEADFCVFPEFSFPYATIADLRKALTADKSAACVYVLPFEHITVQDYKRLLDYFSVSPDLQRAEAEEIAAMSKTRDDQAYVNGALIAIRYNKTLTVIPQRKLRPALLEEWGSLTEQFVKGQTIRVVVGRNCSFAVLICFDYIHRDAGWSDRPRDAVARKDVDLLLVPECNPQPLHDFYLMGTIDLYQTPGVAQQRPYVIFNNVAAGSTLGTREANFGFTRIVGDLGPIADSDELLEIRGYASVAKSYPALQALPKYRRGTSEAATTDELRKHFTIVPGRKTKTLICRPEEAVFNCVLPPLGGGATDDRQVSAYETSVEVYRPLGDASSWERVREVPRAKDAPARGTVERAIPWGGADDTRRLFRELMKHQTRIAVTGARGVGKTVLVSSTLPEVRAGNDRLLWLDLTTIEHSETALIEEILIRIGETSVLFENPDKQFERLQTALRAVPTILVLDGADVWPTELPARLLDLHGWKTLVVVASRFKPADFDAQKEVVEVKGLSDNEFRNLVRQVAGADPDSVPRLVQAVHESSGGSALVAVWTGQFIAVNPEEAAALDDVIAERLAIAERLRQLHGMPATPALSPISLENIYEWFEDELNDPELVVLDILCEMPSGLRIEDLAQIVRDSETHVAKILETLQGRNLTQSVLPAHEDDPRHASHTAHPLVRQLWAASANSLETPEWNAIVDWAESVLEQYKPDRDPRVSPININQWPNVAHVLRRLESGSKADKRRFLTLWRMADQFLWAAGRWRERVAFGGRAERVARELKDVENQVIALYDAQAETLWHRTASRARAEELLNEAAKLASGSRLRALRADVELYRARMLLQDRSTRRAAIDAGRAALKIANSANSYDAQLTTRIGLGAIFRENRKFKEAMHCYENARKVIRKMKGADTRRASAILDLNVGRVLVREGKFADAIRSFESAFDAFARLELQVQQAETAVDYAEALAELGEPATAQRYLEWGRQRLDPLGSELLQQNVKRATDAIRKKMRRAAPRAE